MNLRNLPKWCQLHCTSGLSSAGLACFRAKHQLAVEIRGSSVLLSQCIDYDGKLKVPLRDTPDVMGG